MELSAAGGSLAAALLLCVGPAARAAAQAPGAGDEAALTAAFDLARTAMRAPRLIAGPTIVPKAIYGRDDRLDLFEVRDPLRRELARAVASLFFINDVDLSPDGRWAALRTRPHADGASAALPEDDLCRGERFREQREGSLCSGVLVAPDLLATAGHCVEDARACGNTRFVFGFALEAPGRLPDRVPAQDVYGCRDLVATRPNNRAESGADWALVRLDRPVPDRRPAAVDRSGAIGRGTPVFVIGNPSNLPLKIATGASVRESLAEHFIANLDTYHGNSGSPVFHADTGLLEGLLARGEEDYVKVGRGDAECYASKVFPDDGGAGETVSKASLFAPLLP